MNQKKEPVQICTVTLVIINIAVFILMTIVDRIRPDQSLLQYGGFYGPSIQQNHEYYRIITSLFLHGGIQHLLNNMVMLAALGTNLEMEIGKVRFLLIYFLSGAGGSALSYWMQLNQGEFYVSVGASGAIFGLMGGSIYVALRNYGHLGRVTGKGLIFMAALSLYFGITSAGVDNYAHIGGLVSGVILAVLVYHKRQAKIRRAVQW